MLKRIMVAVIFVTTASSAVAQDSVCLGLNCEETTLPDMYEVYDQLAAISAFKATQFTQGLSSYQSHPNPLQCVLDCNEQRDINKVVCFTANGPVDENEDSDVTQARENCLKAVNEIHTECLSPVQLLTCF